MCVASYKDGQSNVASLRHHRVDRVRAPIELQPAGRPEQTQGFRHCAGIDNRLQHREFGVAAQPTHGALSDVDRVASQLDGGVGAPRGEDLGLTDVVWDQRLPDSAASVLAATTCSSVLGPSWPKQEREGQYSLTKLRHRRLEVHARR